jgi:hypothetical protein
VGSSRAPTNIQPDSTAVIEVEPCANDADALLDRTGPIWMAWAIANPGSTGSGPDLDITSVPNTVGGDEAIEQVRVDLVVAIVGVLAEGLNCW